MNCPDDGIKFIKRYGKQKLVPCTYCEGRGFSTSNINTTANPQWVDSLCITCHGNKFMVDFVVNETFTIGLDDDRFEFEYNHDDDKLKKLIVDKAKKELSEK